MPMLTLALLAAAVSNAAVIRPVANIYSRPSDDSDVVSQALYGSNVNVLENRAAWAHVRTADGYTGWVQAADLRAVAAPYASGPDSIQVRGVFANVYREPDVTKHQPLLTLPFEARLERRAEQASRGEEWTQVHLADDRAGWIQSGDVAPMPTLLTPDEVIALGKRFLGLPYLWGGTSTFGFDCSGFTQMLCRRRGVLLPRDAGPQSRWSGSEPVARDRLQPGDLLYFGASPEKVTHTGMYIGEGRFLHATAHLKPEVQISALEDPHWTSLLVGCRRLK